MTEANSGIDEKAIDSLSVAPGGDKDTDTKTSGGDEAGGASDPRQQAGQDKSIEKRLRRDPENPDAQLDRGLDESMDASDPPSATQPGDKGEPPKSSGYDEAAEAERQQDA
ncbi:MAG: hypothetical protein J0I47_01735 [Sphingomonas sp.]|uniref:hypothetical protein n=1 Tax=Sphingomonas sp. TaxID=28214 RepID=UPI001AC41289|nr:hypothetical protein [Sphingomonas sp.]MBN8806950.1 hypothetical protein [Sphingomonas sp.]